MNLGLSDTDPLCGCRTFVIGCFISVSMGTSMGTIAALAPIAVVESVKRQDLMADLSVLLSAGRMFGDNLSMISDTTIAAVKTQGCDMKDKFKANFLLVLLERTCKRGCCINSAYDSKFDTKEIAPLVHKAGAYYLELFHGATIAFKDMALSILPYLLTTSEEERCEE